MPRRLALEISTATENEIVDLICAAIDQARENITAEAGWDRLQKYFEEALAGQNSLSALLIIAWARAGHPAAHSAIMCHMALMTDHNRETEVLVQVKGYFVEFSLRDRRFVPFPRGRHFVQNMMRDAWLPLLMQKIADETGLPPTRSDANRRPETPSVAFYVSKATKKRGFKISERELNRIYWRRGQLQERIEASMPMVPHVAYA